MSAKEHKEQNAQHFAEELAKYKKKNPDADTSSFTNHDGELFNGTNFVIRRNDKEEYWFWQEVSIRDYLKQMYNPFPSVMITAKDAEDIFQIRGLTDEEATLICHYSERFQKDKVRREIAKRHPSQVSLPPYTMEAVFGMTAAERKRWTDDKRLHVVAWVDVRLAGFEYDTPAFAKAPCYDWHQALRLTPSTLQKWREKDKEKAARERERKKNSKHTRNINAARKKKKTAQNPNTN